MRFSLGTLLLFTLLIASLATVWTRREPWVRDAKEYDREELAEERIVFNLSVGPRISPDGTRQLRVRSEEGFAEISTNPGQKYVDTTMHEYLEVEMSDCCFVGDDLIVAQPYRTPMDENFLLYRRRFPEWWWGHFYRPEVWASLALGLTLIVRFWRSRRRHVVSS